MCYHLQESKDFRIDPELRKACQADAMTTCRNVDPRDGGIIKCLVGLPLLLGIAPPDCTATVSLCSCLPLSSAEPAHRSLAPTLAWHGSSADGPSSD